MRALFTIHYQRSGCLSSPIRFNGNIYFSREEAERLVAAMEFPFLAVIQSVN